jgi:hypothetical protein
MAAQLAASQEGLSSISTKDIRNHIMGHAVSVEHLHSNVTQFSAAVTKDFLHKCGTTNFSLI